MYASSANNAYWVLTTSAGDNTDQTGSWCPSLGT